MQDSNIVSQVMKIENTNGNSWLRILRFVMDHVCDI